SQCWARSSVLRSAVRASPPSTIGDRSSTESGSIGRQLSMLARNRCYARSHQYDLIRVPGRHVPVEIDGARVARSGPAVDDGGAVEPAPLRFEHGVDLVAGHACLAFTRGVVEDAAGRV